MKKYEKIALGLTVAVVLAIICSIALNLSANHEFSTQTTTPIPTPIPTPTQNESQLYISAIRFFDSDNTKSISVYVWSNLTQELLFHNITINGMKVKFEVLYPCYGNVANYDGCVNFVYDFNFPQDYTITVTLSETLSSKIYTISKIAKPPISNV